MSLIGRLVTLLLPTHRLQPSPDVGTFAVATGILVSQLLALNIKTSIMALHVVGL